MMSRKEMDALWRRIDEADKNRREFRKKQEDERKRRWREIADNRSPMLPFDGTVHSTPFTFDPPSESDPTPSYDSSDGGAFDGGTSGGGGGGDNY